MRPGTSEYREFIPASRPQSSKLMTQQQIRNMSAKYSQLEHNSNKPHIESQLIRFHTNNYGSLCDRAFQDISKPSQMQKFGRFQKVTGTNAFNSEQVSKKKTAVVQQAQQNRKTQIFKLIDVDARMRDDTLSNTQREDFKKHQNQILNLLHTDNEMPLIFNYNAKNSETLIRAQVTNMKFRKHRGKGKSEQSITLTPQEAKKLLLLQNLESYLQDNFQYEDKKLQVDVHIVHMYELVTEGQMTKDFEFNLHSRRFYVEMPKLKIGEQLLIPLQNLQMAKLINNFNEEIQQYIPLIEQEALRLVPEFVYIPQILKGVLNKNDKILKKVIVNENEYCQSSLKPPSIKIFLGENQVGAIFLSFLQFQQLAEYAFHQAVRIFLVRQVQITKQEHINKVKLHLDFKEQEDIIYSQLAQAGVENGILMDQTISINEYSLKYITARFEFYNPRNGFKKSRVPTEKELQDMIDLQFNFTIL